MRLSNLIPIMIVGGIGCFIAPAPPSAPTAAVSAARAPLIPNAPIAVVDSGASRGSCRARFRPASQKEHEAFLLGANGRWFDGLAAALLEGDERIHEGLAIDSSGVLPSRFAVGADDLSLKAAEALTAATDTRIGLPTTDGYRLIETRLPPSGACVVYALKLAPGPRLLVRGPLPLAELRESGERIYDEFVAATAENTRIFYRFAEPGNRITATSPPTL